MFNSNEFDSVEVYVCKVRVLEAYANLIQADDGDIERISRSICEYIKAVHTARFIEGNAGLIVKRYLYGTPLELHKHFEKIKTCVIRNTY